MVGMVPVWASSAWGSVSRWDRCHGWERVSMEVAHPFLSPQPEATLTCSPDLTGRAQLEWGGGWEGVFLTLRREQHTRCGRSALIGSGLQGPARSPAHCRLSPSHLRMSPTRSGSVGVAKILKFLHHHLPVIFLHCLDLTSRLYSAPKGS